MDSLMRSNVAEIRAVIAAAIRPEPNLTVSEWADKYRVLGKVSAGEPGKWRTARVPFMRDVMNSMSPSCGVERVVLVKPAQIGGSEALLNLIGYIIHFSPGPALYVGSTCELTTRFSKQRVTSLIQHTPELKALVSPVEERAAGNTITVKQFPGGCLVLAGSNSAAGLRSMPARFILLDEVDSYPMSAMGAAGSEGGSVAEGDPCDLAIARSETFANRRIVMISTPTVKGISRIEQAYSESDQRKFYVPCPHCSQLQTLKWAQVRWPEGHPSEAVYQCEICNGRIEDRHKQQMLERGEWRPESQGNGQTVGFHISGLYSPWTTWAKLAGAFVRASKSPERLRVFVNTVLAESWEEKGAEKIDIEALMVRREPFGAALPAGVALLTCGVDVQADRLEVGLFGWGRDEECWNIAYHILHGDPTRPEVWRQLDEILTGEYLHVYGLKLPIAAACVDSGYASASVYEFCRERLRRRVYAVKGQAGRHPVWPRRASRGKDRSPLFVIGVDGTKEWIAAHLKIIEPGPGYIHFPLSTDQIFFEQLTSETVRVRYSRGFAVREWAKPPGARNEALDITSYAFAALQSLIVGGIRLNAYAEKMDALKPKDGESPGAISTAAPPQQQQQRERPRRGGSWLPERREPWISRRNWLNR